MERQAQDWEKIFFNACYQQRISKQKMDGWMDGERKGTPLQISKNNTVR